MVIEMTLSQQKEALRRVIAAKKNVLSVRKRQTESLYLANQIESSESFRNAGVVLAYWPMADEVDLRSLILKREDKTWLLPCVVDDHLLLRCFEGVASLTEGMRFGIPEPTGEVYADYGKVDMVLVPGVAFDKAGSRLGRGKGFYDRLLPQLHQAEKAGVGFSVQLVDKVPCEPHDELLDRVFIA
ncbi:5-formyltetrahydrofolate cyclo-ligase [Geofilum sp. OHC36d9]|uniref:5-formyltetrahydrofolate cyclo-ligase n=1 Tax=Geofilum sp. OHC36d9 TaxID=3458413 RepID=UPI004033B15D